jgi:ceramide glucosyltransferase
VILAVCVLTGSGGELCLTHAMKRVGEVHDFSPTALLRFIAQSLRDFWMWISVVSLALSFYAFLVMLSWYPVSFVVPATSLAYVIGPLGAQFFLRERLTAARWTGALVICLGVALASLDRAPSGLASAFASMFGDPMLRHVLRDAVFAAALASLAFYLFGGWAAWRFFRSAPVTSVVSAFAPPASILKPVRGLDRSAYENFASFCRQDYPEYEILFAADDESDPAVAVIRRLMRDFPEQSIQLFIGADRVGTNNKVAKLCRLAEEAHHDLLVISDSDVRVTPDYLRGVAAPFADPNVGAVTALYRAIQAPTFGAVMDTVGASASFSTSALVARSLEGLKFTMGSTMATTRQRLAEIGGFAALLDLHSDDYEFGRRIAERGYRVELAQKPVDMEFPSETLSGYLRHELRWLVGIRHIRPGGHFGLLMTQGIAWAAAAALLAASHAAAIGWIFAYLSVRLATGYVVGVWGLGDPVLRRKLWLLPLHDFFMFFVWLASFAVNRIEWRGLEFTLENGRLIPVESRANRG